MNTLADRTIYALRANFDQLATMVRGFSADDLDRQSGSSEWDVAQVLSHRGSASEIGLTVLGNAIEGLPLPGQEFNESVWDRWNAMSQREKADGFLAASERLVVAYERLDEATRRDLRFALAFLPRPADVALMTGLMLDEAVMHAWDVRVAFDPQAVLTAEEAGVLLEQLGGPLGFLVGFLGKPAGLDGARASLRIDVTDPDRAFGLIIGDAVSLGAVPVVVDGVLSGPAEAIVRLVQGRLAEPHTPEDVTVRGPAVTLGQLRRVFPGF